MVGHAFVWGFWRFFGSLWGSWGGLWGSSWGLLWGSGVSGAVVGVFGGVFWGVVVLFGVSRWGPKVNLKSCLKLGSLFWWPSVLIWRSSVPFGVPLGTILGPQVLFEDTETENSWLHAVAHGSGVKESKTTKKKIYIYIYTQQYIIFNI